MPGLTCGHCGSTNIAETRMEPPSPHYARAECIDCGAFVKWMPRPNTSVMPRVERDPARPYAELRGTPNQVTAARSIRRVMIATHGAEGRADIVAVLASVADASWFLANKSRTLGEIRWPGPDQLEGGRAEGAA